MKDIDFDELDRAVSSVLSTDSDLKDSATDNPPDEASETSAATADSAADAPVAVSVNTASSAPVNESNEGVDSPEFKPSEANKTDTTTRPAVKPSIVNRKGGRFMDVVPAGGVVSATKSSPSPLAPSKAGRVVQPTGALKNDPVSESDKPQDGSVADAETQNLASWPDPKEVTNFTPAEEVAKPQGQTTEASGLYGQEGAISADEPVNFSLAPQPTPAATPFISDAKVEKRPLGAFADDTASSTERQDGSVSFATRLDTDEADSSDFDKPVVQVAPQAKPQQPVERLPRELEQDVVAVESDSAQYGAAAHKTETTTTTKTTSQTMTAEALVSNAATMSIPKQYKESATASSTGQHSLFDTREYHPPLAHNGGHGHRSTIMWVIIAMLLLIATAAGFGYWLYLQI